MRLIIFLAIEENTSTNNVIAGQQTMPRNYWISQKKKKKKNKSKLKKFIVNYCIMAEKWKWRWSWWWWWYPNKTVKLIISIAQMEEGAGEGERGSKRDVRHEEMWNKTKQQTKSSSSWVQIRAPPRQPPFEQCVNPHSLKLKVNRATRSEQATMMRSSKPKWSK